VDTQAVAGALDLDPADGCVRQLVHQVVPDLPVLDGVVAVLATVGEPAGLPVGGDAQPEAVRVDLLTHVSSSPRRRGRRCPTGPRRGSRPSRATRRSLVSPVSPANPRTRGTPVTRGTPRPEPAGG